MGLDMTIYKLQPTRAALVAEEKELQATQQTLVLQHLDTNIEAIDKAITDYIAANNHIRRTDRTYDTIFNNVHQLIVKYDLDKDSDNFIQCIQWSLLNNCTTFSWNLPDDIKLFIANDFLVTFRQFCTLTNSAEVARLCELQDLVRDQTEEVAYWRKYHDLNNYILQDLVDPEGDGNCEELPLTKDDFHSIIEFITADETANGLGQVQDILDNWDDDCTYIYHPWW